MKFDKKRYEQSKIDYAVLGIFTCPYHALQYTKGGYLTLNRAETMCPEYGRYLFQMNMNAQFLSGTRQKAKVKTRTMRERLHEVMAINAEINKQLKLFNIDSSVKLIGFDKGLASSNVVTGRTPYGHVQHLAVFPRLFDGTNWELFFTVEIANVSRRKCNSVKIWGANKDRPDKEMHFNIDLGVVEENRTSHRALTERWEQFLDFHVRGVTPPEPIRGFEDDSY